MQGDFERLQGVKLTREMQGTRGTSSFVPIVLYHVRLTNSLELTELADLSC